MEVKLWLPAYVSPLEVKTTDEKHSKKIEAWESKKD